MQEMRNSGSECGKPSASLLAPHEIHGHLQVPGSLCFVKDRDMFDRGGIVVQEVVAKMMHVLDKGFHALRDLSLPCSDAPTFLAAKFVTRQRLA